MYTCSTAKTLESLQPRKEIIVETALSLIGSESQPYQLGSPEMGQSPERFDCSGFVRYVLTQSGFRIPDFVGMDDGRRPIRHANEFWDHYGVGVQTDPEPGDLIFFSRRGLFPTHVGIVQDLGSYIHAPGKTNTEVEVKAILHEDISLDDGSERILYSRNPIGYKAPTLPTGSPTYRYHHDLAK